MLKMSAEGEVSGFSQGFNSPGSLCNHDEKNQSKTAIGKEDNHISETWGLSGSDACLAQQDDFGNADSHLNSQDIWNRLSGTFIVTDYDDGVEPDYVFPERAGNEREEGYLKCDGFRNEGVALNRKGSRNNSDEEGENNKVSSGLGMGNKRTDLRGIMLDSGALGEQAVSVSSSDGEQTVLSSASVIMYRHEKKKKKWYRRLGQHIKKSLGSTKNLSVNSRNISRSAEDVGNRAQLSGKENAPYLAPPTYLGHANSMVDLNTVRHRAIEPHSSQSRLAVSNEPFPTFMRDESLSTAPSCSNTSLQSHSSYGSMKKEAFWDRLQPYDISPKESDYSDVSDRGSIGEPIEDEACEPRHKHAYTSHKYVILSQELNVRQRQQALMQNPFHVLEVWLKEGHDLVVRDSCGTSDPYVKFKTGAKQLYKSRVISKNLNPVWDEKFTIPIDDPFRPVVVKVYDYDRGSISDDPMGSAEIDFTSFDLNVPTDMKLTLTGSKSESYMGYLLLQCTLVPKPIQEKDMQSFRQKTMKMGDFSKKLKSQIWTGVVTIVLVEGHDLVPMDDNGLSDPYVKFRLGGEKYKSKVKTKTLNPRWLEQFDLRLFDEQSQSLEITVYDHDTGRDDFMGRAVVDLSQTKHEVTHTFDLSLEDGAGVIKILLTISGTSGTETVSDLASYTSNPKDHLDLVAKYGLQKSFNNLKDVGWLQVKVYKAKGLMSADIGGKSDPFCVLELVNARLQTQTEYKTLNPEWNKVFTFNVKDIHSVLEVTVYDEDRDKKAEFLGKVAIPLLSIKKGEKRWYSLKDKKLNRRTKGAIQLEFDVEYNHIKAAIRTVNPKEEKYMQPDPKFKISVMKRNINRVSRIVTSFIEGGKFIQSCFDWESRARSITAFLSFLVIVWCFELYMLPISLLILFLKNYIVIYITGVINPQSSSALEDLSYYDSEDEDESEDNSKEEKKSFKEKLQAVQEVCLQVQQGMGMVASLGERIKNTFNWTVPWLSMLAVIALSVGVVVLYLIPLRYLILAWGINKFTKKLRAPNAIPNNELLDFLSRVPSDDEVVQYRELRPDLPSLAKKKTQ